MTQPNFIFNVVPDKHDERDRVFSAPVATLDYVLPKNVSLKAKIKAPIFNQLGYGSCTANAGIRLITYFELATQGRYEELSRMFLYYKTRELEGSVYSDDGATIRGLMKTMAQSGACLEAEHPYIDANFSKTPTAAEIASGLKHRINEYHRVTTFEGLRQALAAGYPVVLGIAVYSSFQTMDTMLSGNIPVPNILKENMLGGHAILGTGYIEREDGTFGVEFLNSWGENWGQFGYGFLPQEYFEAGLVFDMWTGSVTGFAPTPLPVDPATVDLRQALTALQELGCTDSPQAWVDAVEYIKAHPEQFEKAPLSVLKYLDLLMKKFYVGLQSK